MTETIDVWLIEDHKTYGERLARGLNRVKGIACDRLFTSCEDAFAALDAQPAPHVLLLDVGLPVMNGIDDIATAIRSAAAGGSPIDPSIARRVLEMFSKANTVPPRLDYGLTPREIDILQQLVNGKTIKEAAAALGISYYTGDEYIRRVYEKLHVHTRGGAVAKAVQEKLV